MKLDPRLFLVPLLMLTSCAIMHHTQVGEVDSDIVKNGRRFEVRVSEMGFDLKEATGVAKNFARSAKSRDQMQKIQEAISMFQMGPRTGNHVFNDDYADELFDVLKRECPNGRVSGLTSIRETAKYPVVSGEIVKIIGYCKNT